MIKTATVSLALLGAAVGTWTAKTSTTRPRDLPLDCPPAINPFREGIAASGIVEAASTNIDVASHEQGVVTEVFVAVNDRVRKGDPLFRLDTRHVEAELERAQAAVELRKRELVRLLTRPHEEDVAPLRVEVQCILPQLAKVRDDLKRFAKLHKRGAVTDAEVLQKKWSVEEWHARLEQAKARLARALCGAWREEVSVAEQELQLARAEAQVIQSRLERLTIRSPIDGMVLKHYVQSGEYTSGNSGPVMVLGDISVLHLRVQVDEDDAASLQSGAPAIAIVTANGRRQFELRMLRIEPLSIPKTQLTRANTELVDTRVVEVVFELETGANLYPGQIVDTYIETAPNTSTDPTDAVAQSEQRGIRSTPSAWPPRRGIRE